MANIEMAVLSLKDVCFAYGDGVNVLENVNLTVEEGGFLAVLGPNGGGKTTLLKMIVGLLKPTKGEILLLGGTPSKKVRNVGYLPQNTDVNLNFPISAIDVVLMGLLGKGRRKWRYSHAEQKHALDCLEQVGVAPFKDRKIGSLSGGQRQRVLIARALAVEPELLLLDEPTASMDAVGKENLYALLSKLNQSIAIIAISHDIGIIPSAVKSIACVNRTLHFHPTPEITPAMLETMYGFRKDACEVELFAHGVPHRVVQPHDEVDHD